MAEGQSQRVPLRGGAFLVAELFKLGRESLDREVCSGGSAMGERSSGAKDALLMGVPKLNSGGVSPYRLGGQAADFKV